MVYPQRPTISSSDFDSLGKAMRKGQVKRLAGSDAQGQAKFVLNLFQIAA